MSIHHFNPFRSRYCSARLFHKLPLSGQASPHVRTPTSPYQSSSDGDPQPHAIRSRAVSCPAARDIPNPPDRHARVQRQLAGREVRGLCAGQRWVRDPQHGRRPRQLDERRGILARADQTGGGTSSFIPTLLTEFPIVLTCRIEQGVDVARLRSGAAFEFVDRLAHGLSDGTLDRPESALVAVEDRITQAISRCSRSTQGGKVVLILDTPDALPASDPTISALELNKLLLKLRSTSEAHATVLSCLADLPLFSPEDRPPTPLEAENAAFLVQQAHLADLVLSVRELQTGAARDVSGVLRITKGGRQAHVEGNGALEEMEKLYLVQRDGTVKFVE